MKTVDYFNSYSKPYFLNVHTEKGITEVKYDYSSKVNKKLKSVMVTNPEGEIKITKVPNEIIRGIKSLKSDIKHKFHIK